MVTYARHLCTKKALLNQDVNSCRAAARQDFAPAFRASQRHGHAVGGKKTSAYRRWSGMHTRCFNPNQPAFPNYGARGVTVCERWRTFENFLLDMGEPPDGLTLDRWPDCQRQLCSGQLGLATAQKAIRDNWVDAYRTYMP
jgi:hypothetical protein